MINFVNLTVQEVDTILAGLRKLPMELVAELHAKLHQDAKAQWDALQAKAAAVTQDVHLADTPAESQS